MIICLGDNMAHDDNTLLLLHSTQVYPVASLENMSVQVAQG